MDVAVGVGRAVVEDELGPAGGDFPQAVVQAHLRPAPQQLRLLRGQAGAHGEIGAGKEYGRFIVAGHDRVQAAVGLSVRSPAARRVKSGESDSIAKPPTSSRADRAAAANSYYPGPQRRTGQLIRAGRSRVAVNEAHHDGGSLAGAGGGSRRWRHCGRRLRNLGRSTGLHPGDDVFAGLHPCGLQLKIPLHVKPELRRRIEIPA